MKKTLSTDPVVVGGITPLTTIDYPGELAAVIFLQGCPWRCGYCQNNDLIPPSKDSDIAWEQVVEFLQTRIGLIDAVVFSGGEPTLHTALADAIKDVKALGFKIGLHTAGVYPDRLNELLTLVDWVGMDIKSAYADYTSITGVDGSADKAWKSARAILDSGVAYEFRTTVHPDMLDEEQLQNLVRELHDINADNFVIQQCITQNCLDPDKRQSQSPRMDLHTISQFGHEFDNFEIRS